MMHKENRSIAVVLAGAQQRLSAASIDTAKLDAQILLSHILQCDRSYFYTYPESQLTDEQQTQYEALIKQRCQQYPVAYLTGKKAFWNLELQVTPHTLIPRPETELLVEAALMQLNAFAVEYESLRCLDLGTGTGAIALAIASECQSCKVIGVDKFQAVIELAELNRQNNGLENAFFQVSDWFANLGIQEPFHVICSNPPYIDAADLHIQQKDVQYEPRSALVADKQGLADIEYIIEQSQIYLLLNGWLMIEHGWQQGPAVRRLFEQASYRQVSTLRDLAGHERITMGQKAKELISL